MFNLDPGKLLVIAVVAIILLGPDKLPQVARQVGGAWRSFNEFRHRMETEVRSTMPDLPPTSEIARLARSPSALLNHLSNMSSDEDGRGPAAPPDGGVHRRPIRTGRDSTPGAGAVAGDAPPALNGRAPAAAPVTTVTNGRHAIEPDAVRRPRPTRQSTARGRRRPTPHRRSRPRSSCPATRA